jgi:hypothetical protein
MKADVKCACLIARTEASQISVVMQVHKLFYFTSAAAIRQLLELFLIRSLADILLFFLVKRECEINEGGIRRKIGE